MINRILYAIPAYGRKYDSDEAVLADWEANKDFFVYGGSYFNKADSKLIFDSGYSTIRVFYDIANYKFVEIKVTV